MDARGKRSREQEGTGKYHTDPNYFAETVYTRVEQLRVPGNTVFVAEREDRVVDVFRGLVKYNFLSVPVLTKSTKKWYGFLDMADIVQYLVDLFGTARLESTQDYWQLFEKEEEFRKTTVKDIMKSPRTIVNPFHPIRGGYSLLAATEILAKERGLHSIAVIDDDRNLINIVTQSQLLRYVVENIELLGAKREKPIGQIHNVIKDVIKINQNERAIEAFKLMRAMDVSGIAVVDDRGRIVDNISLRDLKAMAPDAGLFWRLFGTVKDFLDKLEKERLGGRPLTVQVCSRTDTLGEIIQRLVDLKIHRIFITEYEKPIGVVSLKDVLFEILSKD